MSAHTAEQQTAPLDRQGPWYPAMPPIQPGETPQHYMDRLSNEASTPFDHHRWPHCRAGLHDECDYPELAAHVTPGDVVCECPCHTDEAISMLGYAVEMISVKGGVAGVHYDTERGDWMAAIEFEGREIGGVGGTPTAALAQAFAELDWNEE